jgi:hypothetical protein
MSDVSGIRVMTDISAITGLGKIKEELEQRDSTDTQKEEL